MSRHPYQRLIIETADCEYVIDHSDSDPFLSLTAIMRRGGVYSIRLEKFPVLPDGSDGECQVGANLVIA